MMTRGRSHGPTAVGMGFAVLAYLIVTASLTGCERDPGTARAQQAVKSGMSIKFIGLCPEDPRWPGITGGAQRYADAVPTVRAEFATLPKAPAASVRGALTEVLKNKPAAVCLYVTARDAADPDTLEGVLETIQRSAALLITVGHQYPDQRVFGHVGVNLPETAERLGENLKQVARTRRSYLLCHEQGASVTATNCYLRFSSAAARQPGLELLEERNAYDSPRDTATVLQEMLSLFPHAGLVVTLNPMVWLEGGTELTQRLRRHNEGFRFATLSTAPPLWGQLGTPSAPGPAAALVGPLDGDLGYAAAEMAVEALMGQDKPTTLRWIEGEIVTAANLPDFARRYSAAANGLDISGYLPAGAFPAARVGDE